MMMSGMMMVMVMRVLGLVVLFDDRVRCQADQQIAATTDLLDRDFEVIERCEIRLVLSV